MSKLEDGSPQSQMQLDDKKHGQLIIFSIYLFKSLLLMAIIYFIVSKFAVSRFWIVVLGVFLFSIPICICGIYTNTIHKISRLSHFSKQGLLYRLLSGRYLAIIFWIAWSIGSSFFMLIQFHTYDSFQWKVFFLTIPVFWCVFTLSKRLIVEELKPYLVINTALEWSRWLCPFIMLIIYIVLNLYFGETRHYSSIIDAIDNKKFAVADMTGSDLVLEFSQSLAFYDGIKAYALSRFGDHETIWYLLILSVGGLIVFFNACAMLSCLLIPKEEYLRLFAPLSATDKPEPLSASRIAVISAIATFLIFFIYLPIFSYIEAGVQSNGINTFRQATESYITLNLEQIDNTYFKSGTLDKLNNAKAKALQDLHKFDNSLANLDNLIDTAFKKLESNVDAYLDWYYSLEGEYGRIGNLLIGELDNYMKEKLEDYLQQQDAFRDVQATITDTIALHDEVQKEYEKTAKNIMAENRIDPAYFSVDVRQHISLENALKAPIHKDIINLKNRLMLSAGGGAVVGLITATVGKKIIAKVAGKAVLKTASKALFKVFASKTVGSAGGAAAGAATGAVIGSIIPGIGTAIGAGVGGAAGGIAAGLAVDAVILKLDEEMNRQEFKNEMLTSINATRLEFKSELALNR